MIRRPIISLTLLVASGLVLLGTCVQRSGETTGDFQRRVLSQRTERLKEPRLDAAQEALQAELVRIGEGFAGSAGIAVVEVDSRAAMSFNGKAPFPQQSVSKLWVALTALDMFDRGGLDLGEPVTIGHEDLTVFHQPIRAIVLSRGSFVTDYTELMTRAITGSDNTANDRILRRVGGPQAVEAFLRRHALGGVQFGTDERTKQSQIAGLEWNPAYSVGRNFYDARDRLPTQQRRQAFEAYLADPMDGASALGIARALGALARGELLSQAATDHILQVMSMTRSGPNRLKGGLPPGWSIAHKTGTGQVFDGEQSGYNDIGVLTAPDGRRYAVAVMIGRTRAPFGERMEMMQAVTRAVATYHDGVTQTQKSQP